MAWGSCVIGHQASPTDHDGSSRAARRASKSGVSGQQDTVKELSARQNYYKIQRWRIHFAYDGCLEIDKILRAIVENKPGCWTKYFAKTRMQETAELVSRIREHGETTSVFNNQ